MIFLLSERCITVYMVVGYENLTIMFPFKRQPEFQTG